MAEESQEGARLTSTLVHKNVAWDKLKPWFSDIDLDDFLSIGLTPPDDGAIVRGWKKRGIVRHGRHDHYVTDAVNKDGEVRHCR